MFTVLGNFSGFDWYRCLQSKEETYLSHKQLHHYFEKCYWVLQNPQSHDVMEWRLVHISLEYVMQSLIVTHLHAEIVDMFPYIWGPVKKLFLSTCGFIFWTTFIVLLLKSVKISLTLSPIWSELLNISLTSLENLVYVSARLFGKNA